MLITSQLFTPPTEKPFENIVGKGENAGKFPPFPTTFLPYKRQKSSFKLDFILSSANALTSTKFSKQ